jgi:short-subunit dehydrogenase
MKTLKGRTAVVTGAASGIGRGLVMELAERGCAVALVDMDAEGLASAAKEAEAYGVATSTHVVDVSSRSAMEALPAAVAEVHGPAVHMLINNAGISIDGMFEEQTLDDWERILGVNLWGVIYGCKVFWDALMTADEAWIVNISSVFGITAPPGQSSYCAAKYAVRGLSEALWEETAATHIGVTVVHPAGVATAIVKNSKTYAPEASEAMAKNFEAQGMPPRKAAKVILDGVMAGKKRVLVAKGSRTIDRLKRLFPVLGNKWIAQGIISQLKMQPRVDKLLDRYLTRRKELGFGGGP